MKQKILKVGNSLGVTIPSDFVKSLGIQAGDKVEVEKKIDKRIVVYKFSGIQQLVIDKSFLFKKNKKNA